MRSVKQGLKAFPGSWFSVLWLVLGVLTMPTAAAADMVDEALEHPLSNLVAVTPAQLDEMRGGFEIDGGLKLSFGIERASYINGVLVSTQTLNVPSLTAASQGVFAEAMARAGSMGLIQNGNGNSFTINANTNLTGNIIQNTVDNQKIETKTVVDSTVNSLQVLRSLNLQSAVRDGIIGALRR